MGNHFTELDAFWKDKNNVDEAKRVFKIYDKDKSDSLDRDEFSKFCHDFYKYLDARGMTKYLVLDPTAKDGIEEWLNTRFSRLDVNNDGKISFEEFSSQISKILSR